MTRKKQKKRKEQAVLGGPAIKHIRATASTHGPMVHALLETIFTNGQRASEPGLLRWHDVDLYSGTISVFHLKGGLKPKPLTLSSKCKLALETWKNTPRTLIDPAQAAYVFPSANPIQCYPCKGAKEILVRPRKKHGVPPKPPYLAPCPHCHATGMRWGMTRHEVRHAIVAVLKAAGIPEDFWFPHVLRHSAITYMLNRGLKAPEIQERVGHVDVKTTYGYMHTTEEARARVHMVFDEDDDTEEPK